MTDDNSLPISSNEHETKVLLISHKSTSQYINKAKAKLVSY